MATITKLVETLNTTIDEANDDIEQLEQCNECLADQIEENSHLISWNRGCVDHAKFTLEEIEKGQKMVVREHTIDENDLITELEQYQTYLCRMNGYSDYGGHFSKEKYGKLKGTLVEMICMWRFDDDNKRYHGKYAMYPANESDQKLLWQEAIIWLSSDILDVIKATHTPGNPSVVRDNDLRIRLASALHDMTTHWMKVAIKHPDIGRDFLDKPFDELAAVDKYAALRDADTILDFLRGKQ